MKLPIAYYGEPILRQKSVKIEKINEAIHQLIQDMEETMHANKGMGLAAVQVFKPLALFITRLPRLNEGEEDDDEAWEKAKLRVYINPRLFNPSQETWIRPEGCLSVPGPHIDVERPYRISIEATNINGETFVEHLQGWEAKCVMHENDHLNGVLFIDRISQKKKKEFDVFLRQLRKANQKNK